MILKFILAGTNLKPAAKRHEVACHFINGTCEGSCRGGVYEAFRALVCVIKQNYFIHSY